MKKRMELESDKEDFSLIIPDELMIHIFSYLSAKELGQISLVNRFWNALANDNGLWTHLSIRDGYGTPSENILNQSYDGKQYYYYEKTRELDVHPSFSLSKEINIKFFHHGKIEDFKDEICKQRNIQRKPDSSFPKLKFGDKYSENQDTLASSNIQPRSSQLKTLEGILYADFEKRMGTSSFGRRIKVDPITGAPSIAKHAISRDVFAKHAISRDTFRNGRRVHPVRDNPATGEDVNPDGKKRKHSEEKLVLSQDKSRPIKRHKNEPPLRTPALFSLGFTFPPSDARDDKLLQNEESNRGVFP